MDTEHRIGDIGNDNHSQKFQVNSTYWALGQGLHVCAIYPHNNPRLAGTSLRPDGFREEHQIPRSRVPVPRHSVSPRHHSHFHSQTTSLSFIWLSSANIGFTRTNRNCLLPNDSPQPALLPLPTQPPLEFPLDFLVEYKIAVKQDFYKIVAKMKKKMLNLTSYKGNSN